MKFTKSLFVIILLSLGNLFCSEKRGLNHSKEDYSNQLKNPAKEESKDNNKGEKILREYDESKDFTNSNAFKFINNTTLGISAAMGACFFANTGRCLVQEGVNSCDPGKVFLGAAALVCAVNAGEISGHYLISAGRHGYGIIK